MQAYELKNFRIEIPQFDELDAFPSFGSLSVSFEGEGILTPEGRQWLDDLRREQLAAQDEDGGWREVGGALLAMYEDGTISEDDLWHPA